MLKTYVGHLNHHLDFIKKKRALVGGAGAATPTAESDRALLASYQNGPSRVREAIAGLNEDDLRARPVEGMWSTQEVIIHLADADLAFAHRLKRIIAEDRPTYNGWSENGFVRNLRYDVQSAQDAAGIIELTHRQMMRIFNAASTDWLDRAGIHSERGEQTARKVLEYATWHIAHHLKFVKDKRERLGKPLANSTATKD